MKEFKCDEIVAEHAPVIKSSERNVPATSSRLIKLDTAQEEEKIKLTSGQEAKSESQSGQSADESFNESSRSVHKIRRQ